MSTTYSKNFQHKNELKRNIYLKKKIKTSTFSLVKKTTLKSFYHGQCVTTWTTMWTTFNLKRLSDHHLKVYISLTTYSSIDNFGPPILVSN